MLIPGQELSQDWEMWGAPSGGGAVSCLRRCDGYREIFSDGNCLCSANYDERRDLAAKGKACKPTTRLSVLLAHVEGIGCWRLETHGFYAAVELAGAAHILQRATEQGVLLAARLRLDQREARRAGQVRKFPVPVIEVDGITPTEMLAIAGGVSGSTAALPPAPQQALPPAREPEPVEMIDAADRRKLFAAAKNAGLDESALRAIVEERIGSRSTSDIPKSLLDELLADIKSRKAA
jgi:hypothetical protein